MFRKTCKQCLKKVISLFNFFYFLLQLYIFRMIHLTDSSGQTGGFSQCVTHCSFPQWWHQAFYNFFTFSCLFIIPFLIMLICNAKIIFTLTQVLHQDPHSMYSSGLVLIVSKEFLNSNVQSGVLWASYGSQQFTYINSCNSHNHPMR